MEPSHRMQFPRVVTKVEIQAQGSVTQSQNDSDIPFFFPTRNYLHAVFNRHASSCFPIQNGSGLVDSSELEPRANSQQECVKVSGQIRLELDDLSAVVGKCNVNPLSNSNSPAAQHQSLIIWDSHSCDNRSLHHGQIGAVSSTSRLRKVNVEKPLKSLKRKRPVNASLGPSSLLRKNHVLSERLRRREMNELFTEMRSLLPNPKAKTDKASILSETMNYIHFLQRHLALHSTSGNTLPIKLEPMSSVQEANENSCDEKLSLKYNGREILITVISSKKRSLLASIILLVESLNIQVMDAFLSITETVAFHYLHLKAADTVDHVVKETLHSGLSKLIQAEYQISFLQQSEKAKAKICDASA
ncbi:hypothetical protein SUGI_0422590 [Cryptomeria japonica]|uniref:uncharacterized protein LOC131042955 n=1 Tax=Cryptomeria japonica TaxID=3369 RepID=UPI002408DD16|nr:uncharacterized protein LOC131042955 [Cryptomeria japonica]GLJ22450.1 hypothetical protein SUGI_0422590 [Cryptomeria japonica]